MSDIKKTHSMFYLICGLLGFISSCNTLNHKRNYVKMKFKKIDLYGPVRMVMLNDTNENEEKHSSMQFLFTDSIISGMPLNDLKSLIRQFEFISALKPDSMSVVNINKGDDTKEVDSFYSNKYKIRYLKKGKLHSNHIHFLELK